MKHFIDIWFMLEKYDLDTDYIRSELRKLHLDIFFDNVLNTLSFWFDNGQPDAKTEMIIQTVIDSGAYGSSEDQLTGRAARNTERNHSKFRAMLSMLFPSFKVLKVSYKYLEKAPFLLPIAWISRWCDALFLHRNRLSRGAKYIKVTTSDTVEKHVHALQLVGIEYNLKKDEKP